MSRFKYLSSSEMMIYSSIYVLFIIYSFLKMFLMRKKIFNEAETDSFGGEWRFLQSPKDNTDFEWSHMKSFLWDSMFWYIGNILITELLRKIEKKYIPVGHALLGSLFLLTHNSKLFLLLLFSNFTFFILAKIKSKILVWAFAAFWICIVNLPKFTDTRVMLLNVTPLTDLEIYRGTLIISWHLIKCVSFTFDKMSPTGDVADYGFVQYLGYTLYFPTLLMGPIIIYERYRVVIHKDCGEFQARLLQLAQDLTRCMFWIFAVDFALHFIYINALQFNFDLVNMLDPWSLYAMGYLMGQFFHAKYVVMYGMSIAFAKMDGVHAPPKPKCIARIHLYSDMWKHFDRGLYEFLFIYIYKKLAYRTSSLARKLAASFVTFVFIFLWHGLYQFILIWSIMNYACIIIESVARAISKTDGYRRTIEKYLSPDNELRFNAFMFSLLFAPAVIANFYFFAGVEIGNVYIERTYMSGLLTYVSLNICHVSVCHVGEYTKRLQKFEAVKN